MLQKNEFPLELENIANSNNYTNTRAVEPHALFGKEATEKEVMTEIPLLKSVSINEKNVSITKKESFIADASEKSASTQKVDNHEKLVSEVTAVKLRKKSASKIPITNGKATNDMEADQFEFYTHSKDSATVNEQSGKEDIERNRRNDNEAIITDGEISKHILEGASTAALLKRSKIHNNELSSSSTTETKEIEVSDETATGIKLHSSKPPMKPKRSVSNIYGKNECNTKENQVTIELENAYVKERNEASISEKSKKDPCEMVSDAPEIENTPHFQNMVTETSNGTGNAVKANAENGVEGKILENLPGIEVNFPHEEDKFPEVKNEMLANEIAWPNQMHEPIVENEIPIKTQIKNESLSYTDKHSQSKQDKLDCIAFDVNETKKAIECQKKEQILSVASSNGESVDKYDNNHKYINKEADQVTEVHYLNDKKELQDNIIEDVSFSSSKINLMSQMNSNKLHKSNELKSNEIKNLIDINRSNSFENKKLLPHTSEESMSLCTSNDETIMTLNDNDSISLNSPKKQTEIYNDHDVAIQEPNDSSKITILSTMDGNDKYKYDEDVCRVLDEVHEDQSESNEKELQENIAEEISEQSHDSSVIIKPKQEKAYKIKPPA